jgi:uncharacterized protein YdaU (DUF1376 family)
MHYYSFNIELYTSHTARLSILEDIAYRRLLDKYYLDERPLDGCLRDVSRDIGMQDHTTEVEYVLNKFFVNIDDQWVNKKANEEIQFYKNQKKSASKAGKASGKARQAKASEQALNDRSLPVEVSLNQLVTSNEELVTNNEELIKPIPIKSKWLPPVWVNQSAWMEFEDHRKEIRKPLTDLSRTKAAKLLEHFSKDEQQSFIDNTIQNRWTGIFTKTKGNQNENNVTANAKPISNHARVLQTLQDQGRANS